LTKEGKELRTKPQPCLQKSAKECKEEECKRVQRRRMQRMQRRRVSYPPALFSKEGGPAGPGDLLKKGRHNNDILKLIPDG